MAEIELSGITWAGSAIDDAELLDILPDTLQALLRELNGFVLRDGALHVRGACLEPKWHSLREIWRGESRLHTLYPALQPNDIPFAQDCVGDQYLLRGDEVFELSAETGQITSRSLGLYEFLRLACAEPEATLSTEPLSQYLAQSGPLEPGRVLLAYPPFCARESANSISLRDVDATEALRVHAELAMLLSTVPDGAKVQFKVRD